MEYKKKGKTTLSHLIIFWMGYDVLGKELGKKQLQNHMQNKSLFYLYFPKWTVIRL